MRRVNALHDRSLQTGPPRQISLTVLFAQPERKVPASQLATTSRARSRASQAVSPAKSRLGNLRVSQADSPAKSRLANRVRRFQASPAAPSPSLPATRSPLASGRLRASSNRKRMSPPDERPTQVAGRRRRATAGRCPQRSAQAGHCHRRPSRSRQEHSGGAPGTPVRLPQHRDWRNVSRAGAESD